MDTVSIPTSPETAAQQAEVQALLASPLFSRAPSLSRFLAYVCERHFAGETDRIREYDIAIHALGRPDSFDQKKDAIVRVEVHRLRKRLQQFYETDGAQHAFRISIPSGGYAPVFTAAADIQHAADIDPAAAPAPEPVSAAAPQTRRIPWLWIAAGVAAVAVISTLVTLYGPGTIH
ncbi:MAG: hypothetical protein HY821_00410 [Acidobacteria bacterium]|nr:hypothetical protein [Acidobacteriota bacterium]